MLLLRNFNNTMYDYKDKMYLSTLVYPLWSPFLQFKWRLSNLSDIFYLVINVSHPLEGAWGHSER